MKEVRNPADRLVCIVSEVTGAIEILMKGWLTSIRFEKDGSVIVTHHKRTAA